MEGYSSDEELYNPTKQKGDVWEPEPKTIVELYEKLDKNEVLELKWKSPGRMSLLKETTPLKQQEIVKETPEEVLKLQQKQNIVSMFEEDDLSNKAHTPSLNKTPKVSRTVPRAKASFDKIFNRVTHQSMSANTEDKTVTQQLAQQPNQSSGS